MCVLAGPSGGFSLIVKHEYNLHFVPALPCMHTIYVCVCVCISADHLHFRSSAQQIIDVYILFFSFTFPEECISFSFLDNKSSHDSRLSVIRVARSAESLCFLTEDQVQALNLICCLVVFFYVSCYLTAQLSELTTCYDHF